MEQTLEKVIWNLDPTHSEIQFKVKHLVISTVTGQFSRFTASLESVGEGFEGASASFAADIDSISTNNEQRDGHLKSPDFFDAAAYPHLRFQSTSFEAAGEGKYRVNGHLTIKDQTHPVVLEAEFGGIVVDPYGQTKVGFEGTGAISRKQFGLTWNATTEAGGVVVSDEVKLIFNVQFVKA